MDYRKSAAEVLQHIGGKDNVVSAAHCATRLRLVIADNSKCSKEALEDVEGVKGVFESAGQLQIIFGTGTVNKVYDEFIALSGATAASKEDVKAAAVAKQNPLQRIVKTLGDVFVPILPAIVATGLMMGLVEALGNAIPSFAASDWYAILDMISNTAFVYLPILIAISSARVFGGNIFLGALIGMVMIHSNLISAWAVSTYEGTIPSWELFNGLISIRQVGYQGHVIPVIIAVFLMSKLETWLHKKVPEILDLFVVPLVTVVVTSFVTLIVIGPIFSTLETYVLDAAQWLVAIPMGIGALIMGMLYPLTVVCGLHHMYNIIELGMLSNTGFNTWMPIASAANFAQCAACVAVAVKTHKAKTRALAVPSALSASLGITEPAIFGVNLRYMKPFVSAMIGGGVAAAVGTVMGVKATSNGVTGIPGFLITTTCPLQYAIMLLVSFGVTFAICFVIYKDEPDTANGAPAPQKAAVSAPVTEVKVQPAQTGDIALVSPITGKAVTMQETGDETFAAEVLGKGLAIEPSEGKVVAPCDATVSTMMGHAIGLECDNGLELLIHIGIDTVKLEGKHYTPHVQEGQRVKAGQLLMEFDIPAIQKEGYRTVTPVIVTNSDDFADVSGKTGPIHAMEALLTVKREPAAKR